MNLEDHLGDIIRKARTMSSVSSSAAAKAGGITEAELSALENSSVPNGKTNYSALAKLVGLNPTKLEGIAKSWLPAEKDLSTWRELRVFTTTAEGMAVNCFLIWDEVSRDAAMFDTGWDANAALKTIEQNKLLLRHLFITHTHQDHVADLGTIRGVFPKVRLHSNSRHAPADQRNRAEDCVHLGTLQITNRPTPGHAEDGVTYVVGDWPDDAPSVAIVGDAIFAGSIGRGNQSWELAKQGVREQILTLPPETLICPGHGPLSTVGEEKDHNPFF